jgi:hypothetical protein
MTDITFTGFPKIARFGRATVFATEKIDGTNAAVGISEPLAFGSHVDGVPESATLAFLGEDDCGDPPTEHLVYAQSKNRIITPEADNFGFARWVWSNAGRLAATLGPGLHFGEWWGQGIQRGYGLTEKRLSLFNTHRWAWLNIPEARSENNLGDFPLYCVPVLRTFSLNTMDTTVNEVMADLREHGSYAAPFMNPEGIVLYETLSKASWKATFENPEGKWAAGE